MVRASWAGDNLRTAAGDHDVLGAVDGLLLDWGRSDGRWRWGDSSSGSLELAIGDLGSWLFDTGHDGAGAKGSEDE